MIDPQPNTALLGRGIYDVVEVAHLTHRDPQTILGWTTFRQGRPALLEPEIPGVYSFVDLISLHVVSELVRRGVTRRDIVHGKEFLAKALNTDRPFAHLGLATVGSSFFVQLESWVDAGLAGQGAFEDVIEPLLRPIEFDETGLAVIWRPHDRVWLNPHIQAGAPCIDGRRVPTATIASLVAGGQTVDEVADDYELSVAEVQAAVSWEHGLEAA